jgi:hypothetical protein
MAKAGRVLNGSFRGCKTTGPGGWSGSRTPAPAGGLGWRQGPAAH